MPDFKQWLEIQFRDRSEEHEVRADPDNNQVGVVNRACPGCAAFPLLIHASSPVIAVGRPGVIQGNGYTRCCGDAVGYVYAKRETLFGLEEDRAVLEFGRARVYAANPEVRFG